VRILPGRTLHLALASRLPRGAYTARLALRQGGKRALTVSRRLAVR